MSATDPGLPPATHEVAELRRADLPAPDGVPLATTWYIPSVEGPFPTVVTRVPYPMDFLLDGQCRILVTRGYACVYQHTRGRGRSGGKWVPFYNEEGDGRSLVQWIREQPWSNQKVAWIGDSYLAATGWTVAAGDPDGVDLLISRHFAPSLYTSAFESGLARHELLTAWMTMMPDEQNRFFGAGRYHRALKVRPRTRLDEVAAGHPVEWYRQWISAEDPTSPVWTTGDAPRLSAANTQLPVMMVGGWSDAFIEAQLKAWQELPRRAESLWVIGPWAHLGQAPADFPLEGLDGPGSGGGQMVQFPRVLDWLDSHLSGKAARYPSHGVASYVVGGGRWEQYPDWPPPTTERRWGARAGSGPCDGSLGEEAELSPSLSYLYDPENPLPSRGGAGLLAGAIFFMNGVPPGFLKMDNLCPRREDLLRFAGEPLEAPLHLAGVFRAELEVSSDAPDSAFGFRLMLERKGSAYMLREGFTTLALREGGPRLPYSPGERVRLSVDTAPLEMEFQPGDQIVIYITSSSFPAYEAHPNQGGILAEATTTRPAQQAIYAATLILPEVTAAL